MRSSNDEGSVSVYLIVSFIVILSLLAGMLEAAGATLARARVRLWLRGAAESVMGEYYGPLYEEYGLYAIDMGFGGTASDPAALVNMLTGYLPKHMDGGEYLEARLISYDPVVGVTDGVSKEQTVGKLLDQMLEAESVELVSTIAEEILARLGMLDSGSKTAQKLEKRLKAEEKLAEIDVYRMKLMRIIDGVDLSSLEGYRIEASYVKRLQTGSSTAAGVGINNAVLWNALKGRYVDASALMQKISEMSGQYAEAVETREKQRELVISLVDRYHASEEQLEEYILQAGEIETKLEDADHDEEKSIETMEFRLAEVREKIDGQREIISEQYAAYMAQWEVLSVEESTCHRLASLCRSEASELAYLVSQTGEKLREARETVQGIVSVQKIAKPLVDAYCAVAGEEDDVSQLMREYLGLGGSDTDMSALSASIEQDLELLNKLEQSGALRLPADELHAVRSWQRAVDAVADFPNGFSYEGMTFDYSQVSTKSLQTQVKQEVEGGLKQLLSQGLLSVLLDRETISDTRINAEELPGAWFESGATDVAADESPLLQLSSGAGLLDMITGIGGSGIADIAASALKAAEERLGMAVYARQHFKSFNDRAGNRTTGMQYEQEYLLTGSTDDSVNLASAAGQLLMLRLIPAAAYAFTDARTVGEAQTLALATMSFTGIPFLVSAVKYLILAVWAVEQAIVETSAIMRGKKVPVITSSASFCLSLHELVMISPTLVREKAESIQGGGAYLEYEDYLFILMLCRSTDSTVPRALDMAQEDIRYAYDEDFRMCNCIVGFRVGADYEFTPILLSGKNSIAGRIMPTGYSIHEEVTVHY